jgi:hypothetical protein
MTREQVLCGRRVDGQQMRESTTHRFAASLEHEVGVARLDQRFRRRRQDTAHDVLRARPILVATADRASAYEQADQSSAPDVPQDAVDLRTDLSRVEQLPA